MLLSPLLFLIVGQALKISLDMQPGLKGILIRGKHYKLLQFADDPSLMLGLGVSMVILIFNATT